MIVMDNVRTVSTQSCDTHWMPLVSTWRPDSCHSPRLLQQSNESSRGESEGQRDISWWILPYCAFFSVDYESKSDLSLAGKELFSVDRSKFSLANLWRFWRRWKHNGKARAQFLAKARRAWNSTHPTKWQPLPSNLLWSSFCLAFI